MLICAFENGNQATLRHVVVDVLVLQDREILLVKRVGKLLEGGKWALPGGYVERDETLQQAAAREVLEETGYEVGELTLLTIRDNPDRPKEDRQNIAFVYVGQVRKQTGQADWEVDEQQWFDLEQLPSAPDMAFDHLANIELYRETLGSK